MADRSAVLGVVLQLFWTELRKRNERVWEVDSLHSAALAEKGPDQADVQNLWNQVLSAHSAAEEQHSLWSAWERAVRFQRLGPVQQ